jgi:hypothetical protein
MITAGRYYMPSLSCFAVLGFQKSTWSTGSAVKFTMNLKVVSREVWNLARVDRSWLPETPAPNARYPVAEWSLGSASCRRARSLVVAAAGPAAGAAGY